MPGIIFLSSVLITTVIMIICFNVGNIKTYLKGNVLKILIGISIVVNTIDIVICLKHNATYMSIPCVILFALNIFLGYVGLKCKPLPNLKFRVRRFVIDANLAKVLSHAEYTNNKINKNKTNTSLIYKHNVIDITDFYLKKSVKKYIIHAKYKEDRGEYRLYDCVNLYMVKKRSFYDYMKFVLFMLGIIETIGIYTWIAFSDSNLNIAEYWFANKLDMDVVLIISICTFIVGTLGLFIKNMKSKIGIAMITMLCYTSQIGLIMSFITSLIK